MNPLDDEIPRSDGEPRPLDPILKIYLIGICLFLAVLMLRS